MLFDLEAADDRVLVQLFEQWPREVAIFGIEQKPADEIGHEIENDDRGDVALGAHGAVIGKEILIAARRLPGNGESLMGQCAQQKHGEDTVHHQQERVHPNFSPYFALVRAS